MKRITIYILIFILLSGLSLYSQGITFDNSGGKITNNGTLRVKAGGVKALPDTIGGRVEFTAFLPGFGQAIPNITFNQLVFSGKGLKLIDSLPGVSCEITTSDYKVYTSEGFKDTITNLNKDFEFAN